jgi:hypothetical protein
MLEVYMKDKTALCNNCVEEAAEQMLHKMGFST